MIFMKFNEWIIFIKESRDWCASKYRSTNYHLIERYDDDDDDLADKAEAMNLLRRLYDESMKILLTSWMSIWYCIQEVKNDYAYCVEEIFIDSSWLNLRRNFSNVLSLYRLVWTIWLVKMNLTLKL